MAHDNSHLKSLRLKCGYTQQEVADKIGVSKATISKYEKGLRGVKHIEELSQLYNVEPIYILTGKTSEQWNMEMDDARQREEDTDRAYWESVLLSEPIINIMPLLDQLNAEGQQKAVERIQELTEIPRYRCTDAPPQSPKGKDTPADQPAAEELTEDE